MNIRDKILVLLTQHEHLRDSDEKLTANLWYAELIELKRNPEELTALGLLTLLSEGKLSKPTSIKRHRAKFQEVNPELRGKKYKARQNNATRKWKKDLKDISSYKSQNYLDL